MAQSNHHLLVLIILWIFSWTTTVTTAAPRSYRPTRRRKMDNTSKVKSFVREEIVPVVSGCVAFYSTLGLSTCAQKMMGISTGTKALARMAGVPSVCIASIAGHRCALLAQEWSQNPQAIRDPKSSLRILSTSSSSWSVGDYYEIGIGIRLPKEEVHT